MRWYARAKAEMEAATTIHDFRRSVWTDLVFDIQAGIMKERKAKHGA